MSRNSANSEKQEFAQVQEAANGQTAIGGTPNESNLSASWLSSKEKWFIVGLSSFAALFSPLTANIYFPSMLALSAAFNKSVELINLTVTMYLVFQGASPMETDICGLSALSCIGLALVPTNAYWLLMFLRCFQASGSASTIAIGTGIVGDISTHAERGRIYGFFAIGPMVGPSIGPIIGGILTEKFGWRSIFWFLVISSSICFVIIILIQPETLRLLVESGQDNIPIVYRPLIGLIGPKGSVTSPTHLSSSNVRVSKNPFRILLNLDVIVLLSISALAFIVFYSFLTPFSVLLQHSYPFLSEADIGLCFLSIGVGTIIGSVLMGKALDMEYARFKKRMDVRENSGTDRDGDFPFEVARLRLVPVFALVLALICAGYGWCIEKRVHLAVPLVMSFIVGIVTICILNAVQTIIIDLFPSQSSSATACNNLTRCTLGAIFVSVIDIVIRKLGIGGTYVLMSGITLLLIPLTYLAIRIGPCFRNKRRELTSLTG